MSLPLAVQLYPGYQETIYGVEGVIVSKRIFAPLDSYYDRSLLWMMEAQAEGDRLIQIRRRDRLGRSPGATHGGRASGRTI